MTTTIDWPALITELAYVLGEVDESHPDSRVPCGTRALAQQLGVERGAIRRWHDGTEPGHADGEMLLQRWQQLTNKAREFAPRVRVVLSAARVAKTAGVKDSFVVSAEAMSNLDQWGSNRHGTSDMDEGGDRS